MKVFYKILIVLIIYALLGIPDNKKSVNIPEGNSLTITSKWWGNFAQNLVKFRITNEENQQHFYNKHRFLLNQHLDELLLQLTEPDDPILDSISYHINKLSALASLVPNKINEFEYDVSHWRKLLKYQSRFWDTSNETVNKRFFQLISESRLAFESALIQSSTELTAISTTDAINTSSTKTIGKLQFKSGDIIAFNLAPKNDPYVSYIRELPNVYKHLGSIHITESTAEITYIDHKLGAINIALEEFVNITATQGAILRLRDDIPVVLQNPMIAEMVASSIYSMASEGTYKYDYIFDSGTQNALYDWELINSAYKVHNIDFDLDQFIKGSYSINLGDYQEHLTAFEIEFDHRFVIAGEWYNSKQLYETRLLTAATSSIIQSDKKAAFKNPFLLPIYRLVKGYSLIIQQLGFEGAIPGGITAQTQLVYDVLEKEQNELAEKLEFELAKYEADQKHKATYLKILQKAEEINSDELAYLK